MKTNSTARLTMKLKPMSFPIGQLAPASGVIRAAPPGTALMILMKARRLAWLSAFVCLSCTSRAQPLEPEELFSFPGKLGIRPLGSLVQGSDGYFYGVTHMGGAGEAGIVFRVSTNGVLSRLVSFDGGDDGGYPMAGLIRGLDGSFYGTTSGGGSSGNGTIFKMTTNGILTTLASFDGANGGAPGAPLVQGSDGTFYGTTQGGGSFGVGTAFKMTTNGSLTALASFDNGINSRGGPYSGLTFGLDGHLYGTTQYGGSSDAGTAFKVTSNGTLTTLASFGAVGFYPSAGLTLGLDGRFYGTTSSGGAIGAGTVFRITTNGVVTTLATFGGLGSATGSRPNGLVLHSNGSFYGTTLGGSGQGGTVFRVTTNGALTTLVSFNPNFPGNASPNDLILGSDGSYYGTTQGFSEGDGMVFRVSISGSLTTLASFTVANGERPNQLTQGTDGCFYGTTSGGGALGHGTVFKVTTNGLFTSLVSFNGINGSLPTARLTLGPDGSFYGTTADGGSGHGTVFKVTTNGVLTRLVMFNGDNGHTPLGGVTLGGDGNLYGTTAGTFSGAVQTILGTVFKVTTSGVLTTLASFEIGTYPRAPLTLGSDGNLYGTAGNGSGGVFQVMPDGTLTWLEGLGLQRTTKIVEGLTLGANGRLYGMLTIGPDPFFWGWAAVFRVDPDYKVTALAWHPPTAGAPGTTLALGGDGYFYGGAVSQVLPSGVVTPFAAVAGTVQAGLTIGADGYLYGVTSDGGSAALGTIFRLRLPAVPRVVAQPAPQTNASGATITFQVSAFGAGPLSYRWRKDEALLTDGGRIAGASTTRLILNDVTPAEAGDYSVIVANPLGEASSSSATLTVVPTLPLADALDTTNLVWSTGGSAGWFGQSGTTHDGVDAGRSGFMTDSRLLFTQPASWLRTEVTGPGTLTFRWKVSSEYRYDSFGLSISNASTYAFLDGISGEVGWEQRVFPIPAGNHALYWIYGKDEFLTAGEDGAWLDQVQFVPATASPSILTQPADLIVKAGSNALFSVVATNALNAPMTYRWFFNQSNPVGVSSPMLLVTNVGPAQLGGYSVIVSNASGAVTSRVANLDFQYQPVIVQPPVALTVVAGDNATFTVTVTNNATLPIGYIWRKGSLFLTNMVLQSRTCTFTLFNVSTNVTPTNGPGSYKVTVTNLATGFQGLTSALVPLTVLPGPKVSAFTPLPNGQFRLQFIARTGSASVVLVSTNLLEWTPLGPATETVPGQFEFTDADAPAHPTRFYQLRTP